MKIVCLDIETTGLNEQVCGVIELGAVILDTEDLKRPVNSLHRFSRVIHWDGYWEPYAWDMHKSWYQTAEDKIPQARVIPVFSAWLIANGIDVNKTPIAGKNVGTFDMQFLKRMPDYGTLLTFRHRVFDPAILYFSPKDTNLPDLKTCLERAGYLSEKTNHRAIDDAMLVALLLKDGLLKHVRREGSTL